MAPAKLAIAENGVALELDLDDTHAVALIDLEVDSRVTWPILLPSLQ
jgi:hypothetical protein